MIYDTCVTKIIATFTTNSVKLKRLSLHKNGKKAQVIGVTYFLAMMAAAVWQNL
jgi:hypothetical protein